MKLSQTLVASGALAVLGATSSFASTIDPSDFDTISTEGQRTVTIDGADVGGPANGDVVLSDLGTLDAGADALIIGRATNTGSDAYSFSGVTGDILVSILGYASSSRAGTANFAAAFDVLVNGTVAQTITLSGAAPTVLTGAFDSLDLSGDTLGVQITSISGAADYDISVSSVVAPSAVPLPAAGFLLLGGLGGMAALRRRRKAA